MQLAEPKPHIKTALILLNYNDVPSLLSALERGLSLTGVDLCVAVDNGSTDGSLRKILDMANARADAKPADAGAASENVSIREVYYDDRLCVVETGKNGGYGFGNNAGVRAAGEHGCGLALIANPDVVFDEKTVEALKDAMEDPGVLAAGAVMEGMTPEECAWPLKGFREELFASGPVSRRLYKKDIYYAPSDFSDDFRKALSGKNTESAPRPKPVSVGAVHGSLVMVRTKEFLDMGGFDEEMFLFGEERVLGRKIAAAGGKVVLVPARYRHAGSGTMKKIGLDSVKREKERLKSEAYYFEKYLGADAEEMRRARRFQKVVLWETKIAARLGLL